MEETLGQRIREARERAILTQDELAEHLGISPRSLQDYEADRATPRQARLRQVLAWLREQEQPTAVPS